VVSHDAAALARALERILREAELRARLAAGCAVVTSRLGWEEPVRDMETLYDTLVSRQAPRAESKRVE
jgi:glycosyltransferase involved in cell wall biosynthesis